MVLPKLVAKASCRQGISVKSFHLGGDLFQAYWKFITALG